MIEGNIRLLAAIMFTDMVGFTALMQDDENHAITLRNKHRQILEKEISGHQGKILQYYGDGTLSMFGSVIEAVRCAVNIQNEMTKEPRIPLRIGIHLGDIVYYDEGIYGDGVNVASRIESLGVPGAVLISDKVFDEIKNHHEFKTASVGTFELKNVRRPIEVFALSNHGLVVPNPSEIRSKTTTSYKSIAVLPFVNMSSDTENEYFSDGITEEILNSLSKVEGFQVTSRTSAFAYKGKNIDIREIGDQLNVNAVLEGSVRKAGSRVRITAQLINTSDGYHIWSESFDRSLEDIFEVQDEISRRISNILREKLARSDINKPIVKSYKTNVDAYNNYLKGLYHFNKFLPGSIKESIQYFEKAIELEPKFPPAYARLSGCYVYLGAIGMMRSEIAYPKAKEFAFTALSMDESDSDSHLGLAMVRLFFDWDWNGADRAFKRAFELNPSSCTAYHYYGKYLMAMNKFSNALEALKKAQTLDPLSVLINCSLAEVYLNLEMFDEAKAHYERVIDLDPSFKNALYGLGWYYILTKQFDEAYDIFKEIKLQTQHPLKGITPLGYLYGITGRTEEANDCLNKLLERQKLEPDVSVNVDLAIVHMGLGNYDKVFEYLDHAYEERAGALIFLRNIYWRAIHNDPRLHKLLEKMRLE